MKVDRAGPISIEMKLERLEIRRKRLTGTLACKWITSWYTRKMTSCARS